MAVGSVVSGMGNGCYTTRPNSLGVRASLPWGMLSFEGSRVSSFLVVSGLGVLVGSFKSPESKDTGSRFNGAAGLMGPN